MIEVPAISGIRDHTGLLRHAWSINRDRAVDICIEKINRQLLPKSVTGYYTVDNEPRGRVLISYLVEPYYEGIQLPKLASTPRQSTWQARTIAELFNEMGYVVDIYRLDADIEPPDFSAYDVLFGLEPNFARYARQLDDAVKIYYATGMHWSQRNPAIENHLAELERRRGVKLAARRTLPETDAEELADALIVVGDDYTAQTYLDYVGEKPSYNVFTSTYEFLDCAVDERDYNTARSKLLWFTGGNLACKGLDVTLEAVAGLDNIDLYVCGPLETDREFVDIYEEELFAEENIHPIGWVDVGSDRFEELTRRCGYVIHTGVTEGFPGGVAHALQRGLVPIVTPEVTTELDDYGIQVPDRKIPTVRRVIKEAAAMEPNQLEEMSKQACQRARAKHSRKAYRTELESAFESILGELDA